MISHAHISAPSRKSWCGHCKNTCVVSNDGRVSSSRAGDCARDCAQDLQIQAKADARTGTPACGTLWRCRTIYNTALEQRLFLYRQRGVSLSRYAQEAELKDLRAALPEYAAIHSHVLQDVLARLDKTYQAFSGASARADAGFPALSGAHSVQQCHLQRGGNGARLEITKWIPGALQDWPCGCPLEPSARRHAQDRHDQS